MQNNSSQVYNCNNPGTPAPFLQLHKSNSLSPFKPPFLNEAFPDHFSQWPLHLLLEVIQLVSYLTFHVLVLYHQWKYDHLKTKVAISIISQINSTVLNRISLVAVWTMGWINYKVFLISSK